MKRLITYIIVMVAAISGSYAMDFGLRFKSHDVPLSERTCLSVGDSGFDFSKSFKIGFFFNFYSETMFGELCSITTDDGKVFSVVASYMNDGTYRLGLAVNNELHLLNNVSLKLDPNKEEHIDFDINRKTNKITLAFNDETLSVPFDLSGTKSASFSFGIDRTRGRGDVAPIDLRNIRVFVDGANTNHWDLKYHETPETSVDLIDGLQAHVTNPHWLIDDHVDWKNIYSNQFKENIQTAFNPVDEVFYIVSDDKIQTFSPLTGKTDIIPVNGGRRPMVYSNHLMYDTISHCLVNYNITDKKIGKFDFATGRWNTNVEGKDKESHFFNHAYTVDGENIYTFGGYGFYKYDNEIFKININTGQVEDFHPVPDMMPLTSASAAVVDGMLYLFGGKGNPSGKQELPSNYTYTMYAYDLNTHKGGALWTLDSVPENFLPTQTMFYDRNEDSFYLGSTANGGELVRISRTKPEWNVASTPIMSKFDVHDFVFDLYQSKDKKRLYLVIDKRLDVDTHDYSILTISSPFLNDASVIKTKSLSGDDYVPAESSGGHMWLRIILIILVCGVAAAGWIFYRKRRPVGVSSAEDNKTDITPVQSDTDAPAAVDESADLFKTQSQEETPVHFDRSKASISLLGAFSIRDKEGNDITPKFTSRLKSLLIMLLLAGQKNEAGIKFQTLDEEIWNDKDERSSKNNRNVSMRKLRVLLEEVGDIPIVYDKGFFKIDPSAVMFDYGEISRRMDDIEDGKPVTSEMTDEILELLLMGPLLPQTKDTWLDKYKADYSDSALTILNRLLKHELGKNDATAYRIAESIALHDPLSEEAMVARCQILSRRKMYGLAKNVYQKFCAEYERSLGEAYQPSFTDVCKTDL